MIDNEFIERVKGHIIQDVKIEGKLWIAFESGRGLTLFTESDCCANHYLHTDDNLDYYVGAELRGMEVLEGPDIAEDYEVHEQQFLNIHTSRGVFTITCHNEHNGYYGGFNLIFDKGRLDDGKGNWTSVVVLAHELVRNLSKEKVVLAVEEYLEVR